MAETQMQAQTESQDLAYKSPEAGAAPSLNLNDALNKMAKLGGFDFLESAIDGVQGLNPERKARKQIFLTDAAKKKERADLKKKLELWLGLLQSSSDIAQMAETCQTRSEDAASTLKKNLKKATEASRELEISYRSLNLFYKNTESDKLKNITVVNAGAEQIKDLDNPKFIDYVGAEAETELRSS